MASKNTTIAIPLDISERIEKYCRYHGILKKDFVSLCIEYLERTEIDLRENELDNKVGRLLSPIARALDDLNQVKEVMELSNRDNEVVRNLFCLIRETIEEQKKLPSPELIIQDTKDRVRTELEKEQLSIELERIRAIAKSYQKELQRISKAGLFDRKPYIETNDII